MRCNNCGLEYIADDASYCPRSGAPMGQPTYQQPQPIYQRSGYQEQQYQQQPQYQQPPQSGYDAPTPGGYYQQPPMPPKRVPTIKKVDLT